MLFMADYELHVWLGRRFLVKTFEDYVNDGKNAGLDIQSIHELLDEDDDKFRE